MSNLNTAISYSPSVGLQLERKSLACKTLANGKGKKC